jgi:hypothetical protein
MLWLSIFHSNAIDATFWWIIVIFNDKINNSITFQFLHLIWGILTGMSQVNKLVGTSTVCGGHTESGRTERWLASCCHVTLPSSTNTPWCLSRGPSWQVALGALPPKCQPIHVAEVGILGPSMKFQKPPHSGTWDSLHTPAQGAWTLSASPLPSL